MRMPIDLGLPLPASPCDVRSFAAELAEDLEWSYKVAREIIGHGHKRTESRYNERVVERAYQACCLVRVLHHARNRNELSMLDTQYTGLCEVLNVHDALLTLPELDTRLFFTTNHDAVRRSTMSRAAAPQVPASRAAPCFQYCALHTNLFPTRRRHKFRRDLNQRSAQRPLHLLVQPLCRQRSAATSSNYKSICYSSKTRARTA